MALTDNIAALALRVGQEIKAVRRQLNGTRIKIGTVNTVASNVAASATIGTTPGADGNVSTLNLSIPRGATGPAGPSWSVIKPKMIDVLNYDWGELGYRATYEVPFSPDQSMNAAGYGDSDVIVYSEAPEIQLFTAPGAEVKIASDGSATHNVISGRVVLDINIFFQSTAYAGITRYVVLLPDNAAFVPRTYTIGEDRLTVAVTRNSVSVNTNENTGTGTVTTPAPLVIPFTISS